VFDRELSSRKPLSNRACGHRPTAFECARRIAPLCAKGQGQPSPPWQESDHHEAQCCSSAAFGALGGSTPYAQEWSGGEVQESSHHLSPRLSRQPVDHHPGQISPGWSPMARPGVGLSGVRFASRSRARRRRCKQGVAPHPPSMGRLGSRGAAEQGTVGVTSSSPPPTAPQGAGRRSREALAARAPPRAVQSITVGLASSVKRAGKRRSDGLSRTSGIPTSTGATPLGIEGCSPLRESDVPKLVDGGSISNIDPLP